MEPTELRNALDGLHAYDSGCTDSGIHDENLRAKCVQALGQMANPELTLLLRDMWVSDEAIELGYGIEDLLGFVAWLEERMDISI